MYFICTLCYVKFDIRVYVIVVVRALEISPLLWLLRGHYRENANFHAGRYGESFHHIHVLHLNRTTILNRFHTKTAKCFSD